MSSVSDDHSNSVHAQDSGSRILPLNFTLTNNDVLCGRGSQCFNHEGNQKFRNLVQSNLHRYLIAPTKCDKTNIIREIIEQIKGDSPLGGFVRLDLDNGRYFEIGDFHAREKTSQAFRDALKENYKSSYDSRKKRRQQSDHNSNSYTYRSMQPIHQNMQTADTTDMLVNQRIPDPRPPIMTSIKSIQISTAGNECHHQSSMFDERKHGQVALHEVNFLTASQTYQVPTSAEIQKQNTDDGLSLSNVIACNNTSSPCEDVTRETLVFGSRKNSVQSKGLEGEYLRWIDSQISFLDPSVMDETNGTQFSTGNLTSTCRLDVATLNSTERNDCGSCSITYNLLLSEEEPVFMEPDTSERMFLPPLIAASPTYATGADSLEWDALPVMPSGNIYDDTKTLKSCNEQDLSDVQDSIPRACDLISLFEVD